MRTREQFEEELKERFPNEHYLIIYSGQKSNDISKFKCLDCGKIILIKNADLFRKSRKTICRDCHSLMRKDTQFSMEKVLENLKNKADNIEFFKKKLSKNGNLGTAVRFTCKNCHKINEQILANLARKNFDCSCHFCSGQKIHKDHDIYRMELEEKFPNKFELLSNYENAKTNIKVRCLDCGFIRKVKPVALLKSGYCPKCGIKESKGEKAIAAWLEEHNIIFEQQKYFQEWNCGLHYFDFYIPDFNFVIEFHGIQHYEYNEFFHKDYDTFIYNKGKDIIKKEYALKNGLNYLSIKYNLIDELPLILDKIFGSTTNCKGKCLEIESIHQLDEDLVSTSMET